MDYPLDALIAKWRGFSRDCYNQAKEEMDDPEGGNFNAAVRDQLSGDIFKQCADALAALLDPARQLIADILEEYRDEDRCDDCPDCGKMVMCRFHSVLSLLAGRTSTRQAVERSSLLDPAPPETKKEELTRRDTQAAPVVSSPPQRPNGD